MDRTPLNLLNDASSYLNLGAPMTEASLQRIHTHYQDRGFGIVTSWRGDKTTKENKANFAKLKKAVREAGFGFIPVRGVWHEKGSPKPTSEPSLFIPANPKDPVTAPDVLRKLVFKLGKKYEQDAVVWGAGGKKVELIVTHARTGEPVGKIWANWTKFDPKDIGDMYSRLVKAKPAKKKGALPRTQRAWTFKESSDFVGWFFEKPPTSYAEALFRRASGEMVFVSEDLEA